MTLPNCVAGVTSSKIRSSRRRLQQRTPSRATSPRMGITRQSSSGPGSDEIPTGVPVARSPTTSWWSLATEASRRPSGLKAIASTHMNAIVVGSDQTKRSVTSSPVRRATAIWQSEPANATSCPSGLTAVVLISSHSPDVDGWSTPRELARSCQRGSHFADSASTTESLLSPSATSKSLDPGTNLA